MLTTGGKEGSDDEDKENALFAGEGKPHSKGNHCGKFGHEYDGYSKGKSKRAEKGQR
jgi:hypothetical protein